MSKNNKFILAGIVVVLILGNFAFSAISTFMGHKITEKVMEKAAGGNADVNVKGDGTMDIKTKDGTFSTTNDIPKDWPTDVPAYAGASVSYSASTNPTDGKAGSALILSTKDKAADVKAFYDAELVKNGWKVTNTMQGAGAIIMTAEKDGRTLSLAIAESNGQTGITIGVEAAAN